MNFNQISLVLRNPSWDLIAIFAFVAIGFFYGIYAGKPKLLAFLFSLYISGFLFENFYYLDEWVKGRTIFEEFMFRAVIFAVLVLILAVLFGRFFGGDYGASRRDWWKSFLLSFMSAGLLISYLFHLIPSKEILTFSPVIQNLFVSNAAFFWWLAIPLATLFFIRR